MMRRLRRLGRRRGQTNAVAVVRVEFDDGRTRPVVGSPMTLAEGDELRLRHGDRGAFVITVDRIHAVGNTR